MNRPSPSPRVHRLWPLSLLVLALLAGACGFNSSDKAMTPTTRASAATAPPASDDTGDTADTTDSGPASTTSAPGDATVPPAPNGFDAQLSDWKTCKGRYECATLTVPLDWNQPTGKTIDLAVIRRPHSGDGEPTGSILFNPGGPGAPGTDFLRTSLGVGITKELRKHFDLVSWDPRGTGQSAGITCLTDEQLEAPDPNPTPTTPEQVAALETRAKEQRAQCQAKVGDELITHVGTRNTVRDLDALRAALGEPKLTYVGYSYGTTIGIEYAAMFPEHIRAMVLDGIAIPGEDSVTVGHGQGVAFEKALDEFLADCKDRGCTFGGDDPKAALLAFQAKLQAGERIPASYQYGKDFKRTATLGIAELDMAMVQAMYDKSLWAVLQQGLTKAMDPSDPDGGDLLLLRDAYFGRQQDGTWETILDANAAINCADTPVRAQSAQGDPTISAAWSKEMPILGAFVASGQPGCYLQPPAVDPLTLPKDGSITGTPPIVIVSSTGDPATPYEKGAALQKIIPNSVQITAESTEHTAYGRDESCIDDPINAYLTDLTVPKKGISCKVG